MGKSYVFHGFIEHLSLFSAVEVSQRPVLFYFVKGRVVFVSPAIENNHMWGGRKGEGQDWNAKSSICMYIYIYSYAHCLKFTV